MEKSYLHCITEAPFPALHITEQNAQYLYNIGNHVTSAKTRPIGFSV